MERLAPVFLLVDDDLDDTFLFEEMLQQVSPTVTFQNAINGKEALDKLRAADTQLPDVIFLDLNMPRMDGRQCLSELKNDPALQHIPVVIYTTSAHPKDISQTMQNGAACFITKPTDTCELHNILTMIAQHVHGDLKGALAHIYCYDPDS
ncbi:response regulator [uncultured Chitinophaga sp.]|jgi:Response regulator containing CheY-like receiver, AAA-type ATPase, and DNA-binding domains|uniref:response regulator n=1 Tax=uncultured Chitinophaga sp. TaxID=339340 RepID=UPI00260F34F6|nr:response regulator [uncultured Chitinophaga sp.]